MSTLFSDSIAALNASKVSNIKRDSTAAKYGEPYASKKSATDAISMRVALGDSPAIETGSPLAF